MFKYLFLCECKRVCSILVCVDLANTLNYLFHLLFLYHSYLFLVRGGEAKEEIEEKGRKEREGRKERRKKGKDRRTWGIEKRKKRKERRKGE